MTLLQGQPPPSPTGNTQATQTDSAGMMGAESLHVLVIGDNPTDRDLIRHYLLGDTCGRYFLCEANTGAEGVALCLSAGEQPDCVLLDLHMPDMDGLEAIAALKQGREGLPFPVIVLTDSDEDADRGRQALAMGAQDYLSKSWIGPESLSRAVNNAIERFHCTQRLHENERKRNEDVLRVSEAFNRTVVESSPDCLKVLDAEGRVLMVNSTGVCLLEIDDAKSVLGKTWWELWPEISRASVRSAVERASRGELAHFEDFCPTAKGTPKWWDVLVSPLRDANGAIDRMVVVSRDITERKQTEAALLQNVALFSKIIEQAPGGVYVVDARFRLTHVNVEALPVFASVNPLIGRDFDEVMRILWGPEVGAHCANMFRYTLATGERYVSPRFSEHRYDLGVEQAFEWETQRITLPDGQHGVVCYFNEVTERLQAEQALHDADRRKDEFLATLAHELRNPLAPIRNAVQLLHRKDSLDQHVAWARDVIDRQSQQMTRLVDDLLDLSRISRGTIELQRERIEFSQVVQQAVETSRPLIESQAHTLTVSLPPEPIILDGDLTRLSQVFMNLLTNAAKYTERGGRIALIAKREGDEVVVSVRDNGIGLPADKLSSIFEMFSQVEDALSRSQGGLGIGLSLVKQLVQMHAGRVEARSAGRNQGSEFIVRLPALREQQPATKASVENSAPHAAALRVLVVDDNEDAAISLSMLLEMAGNTVRTAQDGEKALEIAAELRPHVVLLDLGLPKMNGYEVARGIREQPWGREMMLIAVTGWGEASDKQRTSEAGFDQHIVKPVDAQALLNLLAELPGTR